MNGKIYSTNELKDMVLPLAKKHNVEKAVLFGSYARGDANEASDIDIVIYGGKKFIPTDIFVMMEELFSVTGKKVDIFEINEIEPSSIIIKAVEKEGVLLQ
ncbi:MAG: nucleotidyltransferase family protein [Anaerovoracaceae bacterium]